MGGQRSRWGPTGWGRARWSLAALLVVVLSSLTAWRCAPAPDGSSGRPPVPKRAPKQTLVITLDAGHGGIDGGATAAGVLEKNLTLPITQALAQELRRRGFTVVMTREADIALDPNSYAGDVRRRQQIARESGSAALLSVHVDSSTSPFAQGTLVLYPQVEGPRPATARALGEAIHEALKEEFPDRRHALRPSDIPYLLESPVPMTLVEVGFISNPEERRLLADPAYQRRLAATLARGVASFWQAQLEGTRGTP